VPKIKKATVGEPQLLYIKPINGLGMGKGVRQEVKIYSSVFILQGVT